ncbi:MAG: CDP-glycerol glycerophosphotransferase family protein [Gammaproteobacteria bacterium]|nr:CDP-glycerol glycerophosphotransferase family protein [Gammaproteobacteria bacterium]
MLRGILKPFLYLVYIFYYRRKKIIILTACHLATYNGNGRYLFEYLAENAGYNVYWVTSSLQVRSYLKKRGLKCLSSRYSLRNLIYLFSARIVISPGTDYYNPLGIIRGNTVKICTNHGAGPKSTKTIYDTYLQNLEELEKYQLFDFVNFPSTYLLNNSGRKKFLISRSQLVNLGYTRNDQLFKDMLVSENYNKKKIACYILGRGLEKNEKIILYTPTWRPYSSSFPLSILPGMDLVHLNNFLRERNILLFITLHSMNLFDEMPQHQSNIILIDNEKKPLFDITAFMMEVDVLINDYCTTTTDFSLLGRPQIFVMPDYEQYTNEKGFLEDYRQIMPGMEAFDFGGLLNLIELYVFSPEEYTKMFSNKIEGYLEKYYDSKLGDSCDRFASFICQVLKLNVGTSV